MRRTRRNALAALGVVLAVLAVLCVPSALAFAEEDAQPGDGAGTAVAQIGGEQYESLDEAVEKAEEGATIELLADATTNGMNLRKNLTIAAADGLEERPTVTFTQYGIALWGTSLTFEDCDVVMNGIGSTPNTAESSWMSICASVDASLTLDNVTMTMDAAGTTNSPHAIYFCNNNVLNIQNGSTLTIKNYANDALEWDGGNEGYNVNITDSTFVSDHNRSGFTGTFYATITNSKVDVINSTGNGSNGSHFIIKDSEVNFSDNGSHGLSAGKLIISNSEVTASNNHGMGITVNNEFEVTDGSSVTVEGNADNASYGYAAVRLYNNFDFLVDGTSSLHICNNNNSGLYVRQGNLTVEEGADLQITGNKVAHSLLGGYGGGIYVGYGDNYDPQVVLPSDAVIYNNHSLNGGDDIYVSEGVSGPSLTFSRVGTGWYLDGDPDCTDVITGWFDDSEGARWEAHDASAYHAQEFTQFELLTDTATVTGLTCLKAAHGIDPIEPGDSTWWETSKSKTATNLDENYESDVTLSLPSAEEELASDVVFVLDKSTSTDVEDEIIEMLGELSDQVKETDAKVKVGVVIFNKEANVVLELTELNKGNMSAIETAIKTEVKSGTNTHAGLLAGEEMLDGDTEAEASRKYLVFVSDGITYMYGSEPTAIGLQNEDRTKIFAGPDNWSTKYRSNEAPNDWGAWLDNIGDLIANDSDMYDYPYGTDFNQEGISYIPYDDCNDHAMSIDKALYETYQTYQEIASKYNCYALSAGTETNYAWGPDFMDYLAGDKDVSFDDIQKDIYYLLDAGSSVVDVIGYGQDDKGNAYDFDFIDDIDRLTLTVKGEAQSKEIIVDPQASDPYVTSAYGFGAGESTPYAYELYYYANGRDGASDECFVWKINVPVSNFVPVQLTYGVRLTNPQAESGTYGTWDATGEQGYDSLLTNVSATLYPVDSNGEQGVPEHFYKPTVSYTVEDENPDGGGGTVTTGSLIVTKQVTGDQASAEDEFTFRIKLTGVSDKDANRTYSGIAFTNGVAEITLHGGESVRISGLPAGAKYTVEEIDGLDYTLTSSSGTSGTITAGSTKTAKFVNDKSEADLEPTDPVYPGAEKDLTGRDLVAGEFTFVLTAQGDAPMPDGATGGTATATNQADGTVDFGGITFTEEGTYTYTISEVAGNEEGMTYDSSTHTLVVTVADADGDGKLEVTGLTYDGGTSLPVFTNSYEGTDEPEEPAEPEDPSEPDEPSEPEQPGSTDEPGDVDEPTKPVKPTTPVKPTIPETGDDTSYLPVVGLLLGGCVLAAAGLVLRRRLSR